MDPDFITNPEWFETELLSPVARPTKEQFEALSEAAKLAYIARCMAPPIVIRRCSVSFILPIRGTGNDKK